MSTDGTPVVIRLDDADKRWMNLARALPSTQRFGLRSFPSPCRYRSWAKEVAQHPCAPPESRLCVIAQRDWHVRGQTGCMFARLAALKAETLRWDYLVIPDAARLTDENVSVIRGHLDRSASDDRCQVLSILLPSLVSPVEAVLLILSLADQSLFWLERDFIRDGMRHLHVRYSVTEDVVAWVMAFGPFEFVPNTRRGPFFELAIRMKSKPESIFHRLNQDRNVAHLADVPLEMSDKFWEVRWRSTERRTRMILGHAPDDTSAAKATLVVPEAGKLI